MLAPVLDEVGVAARPRPAARERVVAVPAALGALLPDGGLRAGTAVTVLGATSLALALAAGASAAGAWCAAVGADDLGVLAAAEYGIALERFPLVRADRATWARATAALLDAFDLVLAWPQHDVAPALVRRLRTLVRERGAVLVVCGRRWAGVELEIEATATRWEGLGDGHGRLRARAFDVRVGGRGAAARERRARIWLPSSDGTIFAEPAIVPPRIGDERTVG